MKKLFWLNLYVTQFSNFRLRLFYLKQARHQNQLQLLSLSTQQNELYK